MSTLVILCALVSGTNCWLYSTVEGLTPSPDANWYARVSGPKPSEEPCVTFSSRFANKSSSSGDGWECGAQGSACVLVLHIDVNATSGTTSAPGENVLSFAAPSGMQLPTTKVRATIGTPTITPRDDTSRGVYVRVPVTLEAPKTAVYVILTTKAAGRFSDNFLLLRGEPQNVTVDFLSWDPEMSGADVANLLNSSLRVEHLQMYM